MHFVWKNLSVVGGGSSGAILFLGGHGWLVGFPIRPRKSPPAAEPQDEAFLKPPGSRCGTLPGSQTGLGLN